MVTINHLLFFVALEQCSTAPQFPYAAPVASCQVLGSVALLKAVIAIAALLAFAMALLILWRQLIVVFAIAAFAGGVGVADAAAVSSLNALSIGLRWNPARLKVWHECSHLLLLTFWAWYPNPADQLLADV